MDFPPICNEVTILDKTSLQGIPNSVMLNYSNKDTYRMKINKVRASFPVCNSNRMNNVAVT